MNKLNEKQEQFLAYLSYKNSWVQAHEISIDLGYSVSMIKRSINFFVEQEFVIQISEGRIIKYHISEVGKKYLNENKLVFDDKERLDLEGKNNHPIYKAEEILGEIENIKKNFEAQKKDFERQKKAFEEEIEKTKKKLEDANNKIDTFYGKIGEIITLLIGAMSIIVFNIKVMDTTKVDFSNGYKDAFLNIIAIDLPMIILLVIATILFHYIIAKELNIKRLLVIGVIILFCIGILVV